MYSLLTLTLLNDFQDLFSSTEGSVTTKETVNNEKEKNQKETEDAGKTTLKETKENRENQPGVLCGPLPLY